MLKGVDLCRFFPTRLGLLQLKNVYERVQGRQIKSVRRGDIGELEESLALKKAEGRFWFD